MHNVNIIIVVFLCVFHFHMPRSNLSLYCLPKSFLRPKTCWKRDSPRAQSSKYPQSVHQLERFRRPDSVVNLHKKILKDAGLPHIRFHDLRHTFATIAFQNGVDVKTVSSMLGHYDAGFTLRTYTHATRQKQDEAAATMGSFMAQVM